jgi:hypothetical protein
MPPWAVVFRDCAIVVAACTAIALAQNGVRSDGLPLVQAEEYQILVPCPETSGQVAATPPAAAMKGDAAVLLIDARGAAAFAQWHAPGAINVPFDYLEPTSLERLHRIAASGAREVLVYGDGNDPDSGEQLAKELAGRGIRNVGFTSGGAPAILSLGREGAQP